METALSAARSGDRTSGRAFGARCEPLDWTGRQLRAGSRGMIPDPLAPILERLGVNGDGWLETVRHFGRWFKRAAGRGDSLVALAMRSGGQ